MLNHSAFEAIQRKYEITSSLLPMGTVVDYGMFLPDINSRLVLKTHCGDMIGDATVLIFTRRTRVANTRGSWKDIPGIFYPAPGAVVQEKKGQRRLWRRDC